MKLKEKLFNHFPFLKTKTAKYLIGFSIFRKIAIVTFVIFYNWDNLF